VQDEDLLRRVYETLEGYYELGCEVRNEQRARFVRNLDTPRIYDVNFASFLRARTEREIDAVLRQADEVFNGLHHRVFHLDPWTPTTFEARLLLEGYELEDELQLLLEGDLELARQPPALDIRLVESDDDWSVLHRLTRLDHEEEARRALHPEWDEGVTAEMVATKRAKAPDLRFWLARIEGTDCAFFSSWPGVGGVGKVEDLFTHPDFRQRGIAAALIVHCVRDARERGAGPVLIGALPNDTPMRMYAAMGFQPFCVTRRARRLLPSRPSRGTVTG
jgi:GNAT superfamily N-acetyltransferase